MWLCFNKGLSYAIRHDFKNEVLNLQPKPNMQQGKRVIYTYKKWSCGKVTIVFGTALTYMNKELFSINSMRIALLFSIFGLGKISSLL